MDDYLTWNSKRKTFFPQDLNNIIGCFYFVKRTDNSYVIQINVTDFDISELFGDCELDEGELWDNFFTFKNGNKMIDECVYHLDVEKLCDILDKLGYKDFMIQERKTYVNNLTENKV